MPPWNEAIHRRAPDGVEFGAVHVTSGTVVTTNWNAVEGVELEVLILVVIDGEVQQQRAAKPTRFHADFVASTNSALKCRSGEPPRWVKSKLRSRLKPPPL